MVPKKGRTEPRPPILLLGRSGADARFCRCAETLVRPRRLISCLYSVPARKIESIHPNPVHVESIVRRDDSVLGLRALV